MHKDIGIVVCNYNKQDYIVNCIQTILASSIQNFDLYVVDNASTDQSVELIRKYYNNRVNLLINKDNLGGSGGFNSGLRKALKRDYKYLMCVDNDVEMDVFAIEELYRFLEEHTEVGMVGSKICIMDERNRIQTFGAGIDFENYEVKDYYKNYLDGSELPEVVYCDYVPACSIMIRTEAIRKVGIMPEDNFIYWDDTEWGHRFRLAGYQVAAIGKSKIWHKRGTLNSTSTFQKYYMFRNKINFFAKYIEEENISRMVTSVLTELYQSISGSNLKGEENLIKTFMYAYDDGIHNVRGKADDFKILPRNNTNRLEDLLKTCTSAAVVFNGDFEAIGNIVMKLTEYLNLDKIRLITDRYSSGRVKEQYPQFTVEQELNNSKDTLTFRICKHVFMVEDTEMRDIYIDKWMNIIQTKEEFDYCKSYHRNLEFFIKSHRPIMEAQIRKLRAN